MRTRKAYFLHGKEIARPVYINIGRTCHCNPSDAMLTAQGYEIRDIEIPEPTQPSQEERYKTRTAELIRGQYTQDEAEALIANYLNNKEKYQTEFDRWQQFRAECKKQAYKEIYEEA